MAKRNAFLQHYIDGQADNPVQVHHSAEEQQRHQEPAAAEAKHPMSQSPAQCAQTTCEPVASQKTKRCLAVTKAKIRQDFSSCRKRIVSVRRADLTRKKSHSSSSKRSMALGSKRSVADGHQRRPALQVAPEVRRPETAESCELSIVEWVRLSRVVHLPCIQQPS